jgi:hypothetical protein
MGFEGPLVRSGRWGHHTTRDRVDGRAEKDEAGGGKEKAWQP